jgi:hypothetical protein
MVMENLETELAEREAELHQWFFNRFDKKT